MRLKDGRFYKDEQAEEGDTSLSLYNVNSSTDEMLTGRGLPLLRRLLDAKQFFFENFLKKFSKNLTFLLAPLFRKFGVHRTFLPAP